MKEFRTVLAFCRAPETGVTKKGVRILEGRSGGSQLYG